MTFGKFSFSLPVTVSTSTYVTERCDFVLVLFSLFLYPSKLRGGALFFPKCSHRARQNKRVGKSA